MEIDPDDFRENWEITWERPDGTEMHFEVIGLFVVDDRMQCIALHTLGQEEIQEVVLLPYVEGKDGYVEFKDFDNEEDYKRAQEVFIEYFINEDEEFEDIEIDEDGEEDKNLFDL